ncbi:hypothetical protein [Jannaschia sp. CCS1]|uniref:hypothetical protein n=1 Tax=Jannaschia sp. (strain CCS1) TaxID=290400 RepID=UPI000053A433|nr:hypothetical protein [Jannaschia sp. CCS1]ABD53153.1 hypothetical protein Jann_0236 [Jannaschia sp. CCS1]
MTTEAQRRAIEQAEQRLAQSGTTPTQGSGLPQWPITVDIGGHTVEFPDPASLQQYLAQQSPNPTGQMSPNASEALTGAGSGPVDMDRQALIDEARRRRLDLSTGSASALGGISGAATDGALMGFGDEYLAGLSTVLGVQPDGEGGANWFDYSQPMGDRYDTALDQIRREQAQFSEDRPGLSLAGEVGGSLLVPGMGARGAMAASSGAGRVAQGGLLGGGASFTYGFGEGEGGIMNRLQSGAVAAPVGLLAGGSLALAGEGFSAAINRLRGQSDGAAATPSVEDLRGTANRLYSEAREIGGVIPAQHMAQMSTRMREVMREEGFDADLHPRVAVALERVTRQAGDTPFSEMEILRRVINGAGNSLEPDERRLAGELVDLLDGEIDNLPVSGAIREARDAWGRVRRMEAVEGAIERASLTDNFTQGLRSQFRQILRNPRRLRGFSEQEIAALRRVANGTATENGLRHLSRLMSPTGIAGPVLTGGAFAGGAGLGSLAIPATGLMAGRGASSMTRRNVEAARAAVGRTPEQQSVIEALLRRPTPALQPSVGMAPVIEALIGR